MHWKRSPRGGCEDAKLIERSATHLPLIICSPSNILRLRKLIAVVYQQSKLVVLAIGKILGGFMNPFRVGVFSTQPPGILLHPANPTWERAVVDAVPSRLESSGVAGTHKRAFQLLLSPQMLMRQRGNTVYKGNANVTRAGRHQVTSAMSWPKYDNLGPDTVDDYGFLNEVDNIEFKHRDRSIRLKFSACFSDLMQIANFRSAFSRSASSRGLVPFSTAGTPAETLARSAYAIVNAGCIAESAGYPCRFAVLAGSS
jgi:hypothetical protein